MCRSFKLIGLFSAGIVGLVLGQTLALKADDPPPNGFVCQTETPRNCYCYTTTSGGNPASCYAKGVNPVFYTCNVQNKSYCNPDQSAVLCNGDLYSGACQPTGGPGKDQKKIGTCVYAESNCMKGQGQ